MTNILVWSKDRPAQLDALLTSLRKYIPSFISVLYKYSNDSFREGYEICKRDHQFINFHEEKDFYKDTIELSEISSAVCYTTDDTVVFNSVISLQEIRDNLSDSSVFSFRLGYNTVVQNHFCSILQPPLIPDKVERNLLFWNPNNRFYNGCNYGYPHALDMHMYRTSYIIPLLKSIKFKTTNELEGSLQKFNSRISTLFSPKESVAVNIPINNISGITKTNNRSISPEQLNQEYLNGKRLKYIFDKPVIGCHQDFGFELL